MFLCKNVVTRLLRLFRLNRLKHDIKNFYRYNSILVILEVYVYMEETIRLQELFQTFKKRIKLILFITVIATGISGLVSFYILTPIYQASTQILVNQSNSDQQAMNMSELQTNLQLINTYNVIIKSPAILELVKEELETTKTVDELNDQITVASEKNSQIIAITVEDPDPEMAAEIANVTANVFKEEILTLMKIDNVNILSKAVVKDNQVPVKPRSTLNMAIALVVGLMAGVGLAFLLEYLDNTIKNEQDIEQFLHLPVLGAVSTISHEADRKRKTLSHQKRSEPSGA